MTALLEPRVAQKATTGWAALGVVLLGTVTAGLVQLLPRHVSQESR